MRSPAGGRQKQWTQPVAGVLNEGGSVNSGADLLQFTSGGHVLGFAPNAVYVASGSHSLHVEFVNPLTVKPAAIEASSNDAPRKTDSSTRKTAPLSKVTYANLWPGVTLNYDAPGGALLRSSYRVEPQANADSIRLRYNAPVSVQSDGTLRISFKTGAMTESAPRAWQERAGKQLPVQVAFSQRGDNEIAFAVGDHDPGLPLFIDPTLTWNTFLGGSGADQAWGVAVDDSGNVYVTGNSDATWGSPVRAYSSGEDAFAAKLDSSGNLIWNTFLGSSGVDQGFGVAVDGSGNVFVAGRSEATWGSPVRAHSSGEDAFAAKLDSSGNLTWNTFLGGSGNDEGRSVAVDGSGNVYVTGFSNATWGSPVRAFSSVNSGFAAKLDSSGNLTWNTFLGAGYGVAVDVSGNVYVTGVSNASWGSPVRAYSSGGDASAAKLDSSGNLIWNTFLGGSGFDDEGRGVAVDGSGNVYVTGYSNATWGSPVRAYTSGINMYDAFAAKLDSNGNLTWNTFLGGSAGDQGWGVAVDGSGSVFVTGSTGSTWGSPARAYSSSSDAFAAELDSSGNLTWNTFLGGDGYDVGYGVAVDGSGNVYVAGYGGGATWGSPVRAYTPIASDAFVAKIVKINQTITVGTHAPANATYNANFTVAATSDSGLAVSYSNAGACTNVGAVFTMTSGTGTCTVKYDQAGNSDYNAAAQVTETVTAQKASASTGLSSSLNPSTLGQSVTFTAVVTSTAGTPTGTVQFKDGGANLGAPMTLNGSGVAQLTTSSLTAGPHTITADYSGDTNFATSTGTLSVGQVVNNPPLISFSQPNYNVNENAGSLTVTVNRTGDTSSAATVDYATSDDSNPASPLPCAPPSNGIASSRCDFTTATGTLSFAAGETSKTFLVLINQDSYVEGPEAFTVTLSNLTGGAVFAAPSTATVTINDVQPSASPVNVIDIADIFVRQHYRDFLNRETDPSGLDFWTKQITSCGSDAQCIDVKRVNVSAAFYLSIEFQETGGYAIRVQRSAFGKKSQDSTRLTYVQFISGAQFVGNGVVVGQPGADATLSANKDAYATQVVTSTAFTTAYAAELTADQFVTALYNTAGVTPTAADKNAAVTAFGAGGTTGRAAALRSVADSSSVRNAEFSPAFVLMEYFGYLRRNPDQAGYDFWLTKLNNFGGDAIKAEMVRSFIVSDEYRQRFGP